MAAASPAIRPLGLERFGLRWRQSPLVLAHPLQDGRAAVLSTDIETTAANLDQFAPGDGTAWVSMIEEWDRISDPMLHALLGPFPPLRPAGRLGMSLGPKGVLRLARHMLLPVRRLKEERFEGEGAGLLLGGSGLHADLSPETAGSGLYGWILCCLGQRVGFPVPEGGAGALTAAMVSRLESRGGQVVCDAKVTGVVVRAGRAVGVRTAGGTSVDADRAELADVSSSAKTSCPPAC